MCLHINWKAHVACELNIIVKGGRTFKVTGSHIYSKSDIVEMVQNRDKM